jgi:hypothetical protein
MSICNKKMLRKWSNLLPILQKVDVSCASGKFPPNRQVFMLTSLLWVLHEMQKMNAKFGGRVCLSTGVTHLRKHRTDFDETAWSASNSATHITVFTGVIANWSTFMLELTAPEFTYTYVVSMQTEIRSLSTHQETRCSSENRLIPTEASSIDRTQ